MKLLFLRGRVPQDRDPQEIVFDKLEDCDDVWTQLAYAMLGPNDFGEVWYWGGKRNHVFKANLVERWRPRFKNNNIPFLPDVIFCRGGFPEYEYVNKEFPKAFKVYYGAGSRYLPPEGKKYGLILQDSAQQVVECRRKYPAIRSELFIKPAPKPT